MKATLVMHERYVLDPQAFVEIVIWRVPNSVRGSEHSFKYRMAYVVGGRCILRYDNEAGKGDHRHFGDQETPYRFSDYDRLIEDFWDDVSQLRSDP